MSPQAITALNKIIMLRRYALPQSTIAEKRILQTLTIADFTAVVVALENGGPQ